MEPEILEAFEKHIFNSTFVVCSPEMWTAESVLFTDEYSIVESYLDSFDTEGSELPVVIHGVILPARLIQQKLSNCTNLFIMTFTEMYDTTPLYNDMNVMMDGDGVVLDVKINEITFKNVETNMLEHISTVIEEEMDKDNLDIDDVFLIAGYKPRTIITMDEGTVDESKLEEAKQIADVAQEIQNGINDEHFNGQVF